MLRALLKASELFNSWLEGPYGTLVKVVYVSLFFGAGVLGLYALSRSLESLAAEHDAKVLEVLKAAEQTGEAETQEELKDTEDTEELRKRGGARGARGARGA
ncbi:unnamed protein product [Durusdinium trenchii]|uniref:Uncharacterized protein n=1 Tax=Durusdinium trenchii TaxID=1381693 RepID=A0ABP0K0Z2_9DINO